MSRARGLVLGVQVALVVAGILVGGLSLAIAGRIESVSLATMSPISRAIEFTAGGLLITAGLLTQHRTSTRAFGYLIAAAGFCWFVMGWNSPAVGSSVMFTAGLLFSTIAPVLIAHAVLRYPDRGLTATERLTVGVSYCAALILSGVLPAIFFDPGRQSCAACPANLVAFGSNQAIVEASLRVGVVAGAAWTIGLVLLVGYRLVKSTPARRRAAAPVSVPAIGYLLIVSADYWYSAGRGFLSDDAVDQRYRTVEGLALILLVLGTMWAPVRRRVTRSTVAGLVVAVADAPPAGGLREALAGALGDPSILLLYPLADGRQVDSSGHPAEARAGQAVTRLVRKSETVAVLAHRPGLLDVADLVDEVAATARLALENERLRAEAQAQLADLRAARARIVAASDRERRRLERDLHDGAQQRLVTLSLAIRLAVVKIGPADRAVDDSLEMALRKVTDALGQLRVLARGLYPRELADEGLAAGLESFAETAPIPVRLAAIDDHRYPATIESTAYFAVTQSILRSVSPSASVTMRRVADRLHVEVDVAAPLGDLTDVEDRVGAVGGALALNPFGCDRVRMQVELPCAS